MDAPKLPRHYDREAVQDYFIRRPISIVNRLARVFYELTPLAITYVRDFWIAPAEGEKALELQILHAESLREALTNLGPAFVKGRFVI